LRGTITITKPITITITITIAITIAITHHHTAAGRGSSQVEDATLVGRRGTLAL
jgi:hypothetical protein